MPTSRVTNIGEVSARLRLIGLRAVIRMIRPVSGYEMLPYLYMVDAACKTPGVAPDRVVDKLFGVYLPEPIAAWELSRIVQGMIDELQPPTIIDGHWKEE